MNFLINCIVCGREVSRAAARCPHCGDPHFAARDKKAYLRCLEIDKETVEIDKEIERLNEGIREGEEAEREEREEREKKMDEVLDLLRDRLDDE